METLYILLAAAGGTIMVCQFVMTLIGLGGDHEMGSDHDVSHDFGTDADHDHAHGHHDGSSWFFGLLSFRSIVAAIAFFGFGGWASTAYGLEPPFPWLIGLGTGGAALVLVGWMMQSLYNLQSEGNVRIDRAVGAAGTVYLSIPGQRGGVGKITLKLQNRTVEYPAVTSQGDLKPGTRVVVIGVISSDTLEVARETEVERVVSHA